jgi:hypothetical protein
MHPVEIKLALSSGPLLISCIYLFFLAAAILDSRQKICTKKYTGKVSKK